VLIKVKACALNHLDIWIRQGNPAYPMPLPHVSGSDVAGGGGPGGGGGGEGGAERRKDGKRNRRGCGGFLWQTVLCVVLGNDGSGVFALRVS